MEPRESGLLLHRLGLITRLIRPIVGATVPTPLTSPIVTSLTEFTQLVETRLATAKGPLWHRGCADFAAHHLSPTLYRHPTTKDAAELLKLEVKMLSRFRQRSIPFVRAPLRDDDWERLFFMQHFGIPTRLLDWTENPFVAMYFALTPHPVDATADSAVWILDPVAWNQKSLDHISYSGGILSVEEGLLDTYKPGAELDDMNTDPVAIYGFHNSARIRDFLLQFDTLRHINRQRASEQPPPLDLDSELLTYDFLNRSPNDQASCIRRYAILEARFEAYLNSASGALDASIPSQSVLKLHAN